MKFYLRLPEVVNTIRRLSDLLIASSSRPIIYAEAAAVSARYASNNMCRPYGVVQNAIPNEAL